MRLRAVVVTGMSAALLAGLSACSDGAAPAEETLAEDGIPGMAVSDQRLILGAVEGDPAVVYFKLEYDGERAVTIRRADVTGAESAMLHETVEISGEMQMGEALPVVLQPGGSVSFEPGGRHIMVFGPSADWAAGGETEVTLTIAGGDKHSFTAPIQAAGEDR